MGKGSLTIHVIKHIPLCVTCTSALQEWGMAMGPRPSWPPKLLAPLLSSRTSGFWLEAWCLTML